jgi:hypothetical protein
MDGFTSVTYETLLAYVLPASIVEILILLLISSKIPGWDKDTTVYLILGFLGISIVIGLLINAFGTALTTKIFGLQKKWRNEILFGKPKKPSVLSIYLDKYLKKVSPDKEYNDLSERAEFVYAIFNVKVSEHIYSRRNWDWYFYQSSRNILISSPITIILFIILSFQKQWLASYVILTLLVLFVCFWVIYLFMRRQLDIYYGYYASVVLGYLLKIESKSDNT